VQRVECSYDGGWTWKTATGTTSWSITIDTRIVGNGSRTFLFRAIDNAGQQTIFTQSFSGNVLNTGLLPTVTTLKTTYSLTDTVKISFIGAPGWPKDWIGIFKSSDASNTVALLVKRYSNGTYNDLYATTGVTSGSMTFGVLPAGNYEARMFENGSWSKIGQCSFSVTGVSTNASAMYMTTDTVTSGNWKGVYGNEGVFIAGHDTTLPSYAILTQSGTTLKIDSDTSRNTIDLQKNKGDLNFRVASRLTGYYVTNIYLNLYLNDAKSHKVAVYCVGSSTTVQMVDVLDAVKGTLLDSRELRSYNNGKYVVWQIKGNVKLRFTSVYPYCGEEVRALFIGGDTLPGSVLSESKNSEFNQSVKSSIVLSANPLQSGGIVNYILSQTGETSLSLYTMSGKLVKTLANGVMTKGAHKIIWKGVDNTGNKISSGCYVIKLSTGSETKFQRIVLIR
jgi:hypothetical protein